MRTILVRSWVVASVFLPVLACAAVTVTPASGGSALSADTAGGTYASLGAITITEGDVKDFPKNQTNKTFILTAPSGFSFNTSQSAPSVTFTATRDILSASAAVTSSSTVTVTFSTDNGNNGEDAFDTMVIGAVTPIQIRPTAGTPLASGQLYQSTAGGGTAGAIVGITTTNAVSGSGATNFGTLAEVAGAASGLTLTPANSTITADQTATFVATSVDQFGNSLGTVTGSTVFSISGGAGGSFAANVYSPNTAGSWTVTGTKDAATGTTGLTVTAGAASTAAIAASPASPIEAGSSTALTVTVKDSHDNAVADGTAVTVNSTFGTVTGSGTTVSGVVTRTLSANAVGAATLSVAGLSVTGTTSVSFQDTTAPVIAAHAGENAEATSASGATVTYASPATSDAVDGASTASCAPVSGSTFAIGTTAVTCTKTDASGNVAAPISFNVVVVDTSAPSLSGVSNVTMEAATASGATVTYTVPTATDAVDGSVAVSCSPASGSIFAIGTTPVTCTATDAHGNGASSSFNVIIQDMTAPALVLPAGVSAEATSASGATVTFAASATDLVDGSVSVSCVPASGSTFALGTTTVNCSATDSNSNVSTGSFGVTVSDTTAPSAPTHAAVSVLDASGPTAVSFTNPVSTDAVDTSVAVSCVPASGSTFALGTTAVTCTAADDAGNSSSASFTITVGTLDAPVADVPAGSYLTIQTVSLSAPNASNIRYALDGSTPTCSSGTPYSSPIVLISSKTITAVACYPYEDGEEGEGGFAASAVSSFAYSIDLQGPPGDFAGYITNGVFVPAAEHSMSSTPTVTVTEHVTVHIATSLGIVDVTIPADTVIAAADGSTFDGTLLSGSDAILAPLGNLASAIYINGAIQWGIPSFGLVFSPAITISIPVRDAADGTVLTVYRSVTGKSGWTDDGVAGTCTVTNGTCVFSATKASYYAVTSTPSGATGSGAGGSSGSGTPAAVAAPAPVGQVLGASLACGKYLNSYLKYGAKNDAGEVRKLQEFLNEQGFTVTVTGIYDRATRTAVMAFQRAHKNETLVPWGGAVAQGQGTGIVYKTTQWLINSMKCPALGLPRPDVQ